MAPRAMLAVLIVFASVASLSVAAASGHGSIYLTTLPPGATVWMDGNYMGATPLFVDGLDSGRHRITFTRSGWQPQSTAADVTVGQVTTVSAVLTSNAPLRSPAANKSHGTLLLRGANGARVFIDGVPVQAPNDALAATPGDHILTVQRGNTKMTSSVRIYPDSTTTVSLAPSGKHFETTGSGEDVLAALQDYVPTTDFVVSGDVITIHFKGVEVECAVGSHTYVFNGKAGTVTVAPAMVGDKPYLPLSLLHRIAVAEETRRKH